MSFKIGCSQKCQDKSIFELAKAYAYDYADTVLERSVFPDDEALNNLNSFDENMPNHMGDSKEILTQLHQHGSPATIAQIGGRYFGLVNGGIIPAALSFEMVE